MTILLQTLLFDGEVFGLEEFVGGIGWFMVAIFGDGGCPFHKNDKHAKKVLD